VERAHHRRRPSKSTAQEDSRKGRPPFSNPDTVLVDSVEKAGPVPSKIQGGSIKALAAPPDLRQMQCLSILIADVSQGQTSVPDTAVIPLWLSCIPERLGKSFALDQAVRCFAVHHMGNMYGNDAMIIHGRSAYGQALSSLQKAFRDPVKVFSSGTLCAAMLLCMYKVGIR
jgi:hypothetical protein